MHDAQEIHEKGTSPELPGQDKNTLSVEEQQATSLMELEKAIEELQLELQNASSAEAVQQILQNARTDEKYKKVPAHIIDELEEKMSNENASFSEKHKMIINLLLKRHTEITKGDKLTALSNASVGIESSKTNQKDSAKSSKNKKLNKKKSSGKGAGSMTPLPPEQREANTLANLNQDTAESSSDADSQTSSQDENNNTPNTQNDTLDVTPDIPHAISEHILLKQVIGGPFATIISFDSIRQQNERDARAMADFQREQEIERRLQESRSEQSMSSNTSHSMISSITNELAEILQIENRQQFEGTANAIEEFMDTHSSTDGEQTSFATILANNPMASIITEAIGSMHDSVFSNTEEIAPDMNTHKTKTDNLLFGSNFHILSSLFNIKTPESLQSTITTHLQGESIQQDAKTMNLLTGIQQYLTDNQARVNQRISALENAHDRMQGLLSKMEHSLHESHTPNTSPYAYNTSTMSTDQDIDLPPPATSDLSSNTPNMSTSKQQKKKPKPNQSENKSTKEDATQDQEEAIDANLSLETQADINVMLSQENINVTDILMESQENVDTISVPASQAVENSSEVMQDAKNTLDTDTQETSDIGAAPLGDPETNKKRAEESKEQGFSMDMG